jgi:hypothetical protein
MDNAIGGVDSREVGALGIARFKYIIAGVAGIIVCAANAVVDMLTVASRIWTSGITGLEAETIVSHEADGLSIGGYEQQTRGYILVPFDDLPGLSGKTL